MKHMGRIAEDAAVFWVYDWGIPLIVAIWSGIIFYTLATEYRPAFRKVRYFNAFVAVLYMYLGLHNLSSAITENNPFLLISFSLDMALLYFFAIHGYKTQRDAYRAIEEKAANQPEPLWLPELVVGYRVGVHSLRDEPYTGAKAICRMGETTDILHYGDSAPAWHCRCGYYAMKKWEDVPMGNFAVVVLMWGRVIEHENGYRAEYMKPIGFIGRRPVVHIPFLPPDFSSWNSPPDPYSRAIDPDHCLGYQHLPVVRTNADLNALIEKARKEFDPEKHPPYDGGQHGHR